MDKSTINNVQFSIAMFARGYSVGRNQKNKGDKQNLMRNHTMIVRVTSSWDSEVWFFMPIVNTKIHQSNGDTGVFLFGHKMIIEQHMFEHRKRWKVNIGRFQPSNVWIWLQIGPTMFLSSNLKLILTPSKWHPCLDLGFIETRQNFNPLMWHFKANVPTKPMLTCGCLRIWIAILNLLNLNFKGVKWTDLLPNVC